MSMKPGATTRPRASIRRPADIRASEPIAAIRPARMPTSAWNQGVPVPSITRPCSITVSKTGVPDSARDAPAASNAIAHGAIQPRALAPSERDGIFGARIECKGAYLVMPLSVRNTATCATLGVTPSKGTPSQPDLWAESGSSTTLDSSPNSMVARVFWSYRGQRGRPA